MHKAEPYATLSANRVRCAKPAEEFGIDIAGDRQFDIEEPAIPRHLLRFDDSPAGNRRSRLVGHQQMLLARMNSRERRRAHQMNRGLLCLRLKLSPLPSPTAPGPNARLRGVCAPVPSSVARSEEHT